MKPLALPHIPTKSFSTNSVLKQLERQKTIVQLAVWLSEMTEEHISPRTLLHLLHAQLALMVVLMPVVAPVWWHVSATLWAVRAFYGGYRCWKASNKAHTKSSPKRI